MRSFFVGAAIGAAALLLSFGLRALFGGGLLTSPIFVFFALQAVFWLGYRWYLSRSPGR